MSGKKSIKSSKLTPTQAKVAKKKIEADLSGKSISEVAPSVFPNQTPAAARVSMSRVLQNATVQEVLAQAMADLGLTPETLAEVVSEAAKAKKVVQIEGDFYETDVPDHTTRLNAVRTAAQWLGVGKSNDQPASIHFHQHVNDKKANYNF